MNTEENFISDIYAVIYALKLYNFIRDLTYLYPINISLNCETDTNVR